MESNIRTMDYLYNDNFSNPVYRCIETGTLYKDIGNNHNEPDLYSCGNEPDGDPCYPIKRDLVIKYNSKYTRSNYEFEYMLLSRLKQDCNYYLGTTRYAGHLWAKDEVGQIAKMKELYNTFPENEKPEWLTWDEILKYEKQMVLDKEEEDECVNTN